MVKKPVVGENLPDSPDDERLMNMSDLIYDACLSLFDYEPYHVTGYVRAVIQCDFDSPYLPLCHPLNGRETDEPTLDECASIDVLTIISDFCELPPMLPHIHSFIDALWEFNLGEA